MIKYKNLFLAAICIAAGTLAIMTNLHKPNKNMLTSTTKLNDSYKIERATNNKQKSNLNIKNLNFSLNNNKNNLNKIVFNSEESFLGFKSTYTLATIPHKIIKAKKMINNINKKEKDNNIKINSKIKNIKTTFVANETISYSNYVRNYKGKLFSKLSFNNIANNSNNNILTKTQNKALPTCEWVLAGSEIGFIVGGVTGLVAYGVWNYRKNIKGISNVIVNHLPDVKNDLAAIASKIKFDGLSAEFSAHGIGNYGRMFNL